MTEKRYAGAGTASPFVEFGVEQKATGPLGAGQIPRDDILQYIHEMCATLSYMSIAHNCDRLSGLLAAAAAEAESHLAEKPGNASSPARAPQSRAVRSDTR